MLWFALALNKVYFNLNIGEGEETYPPMSKLYTLAIVYVQLDSLSCPFARHAMVVT